MFKKNNKKIIFSALILFWAQFVSAASFADVADVLATEVIGTITSLAFGLAIMFFFWGVFVFMTNANDSGKREEGKNRMIFGFIAIFVMVSVWGIVKIAMNSVELDNNTHLKIQLR